MARSLLDAIRKLRGARLAIALAAVVILGLVASRAATALYVDALWYREMGYASVFWRTFAWVWGVRLLVFLVVGFLIHLNLRVVARSLGTLHIKRRFGNLEIAERLPAHYVTATIVSLSALLAAWFAASVPDGSALSALFQVSKVPWGQTDPFLGLDLSFFVFSLPILRISVTFLMVVVFLAFTVVTAGYATTGSLRFGQGGVVMTDPARKHMGVLVASFLVLIAAHMLLGMPVLLLFGSSDVQSIFGYTDEHARMRTLPLQALVTLAGAAGVLLGAWKNRLLPAAAGIGGVIVAAIGVGRIYPSVVQRFQVVPNELGRESPYIARSLEFTRLGFGLDSLERVRYDAKREGDVDWAEASRQFAGLPVWSANTLLTAFREVEARRRYYDFGGVFVDRYQRPDGSTVPVALAVREVDPAGIEEPNWQNLHLRDRYIAGNGAVAVDAAARTPEGRPENFLAGIPATFVGGDAPPALNLQRSSVFVGIRSQPYALVNPTDSAFMAADSTPGVAGVDFPTGIPVAGLRKLLFAWYLREANVLFSSEVGPESRLVLRRGVLDRAQAVAPFLRYPESPYPVLAGGRLVWVLEGFTATRSFPLSRAFALEFRRPVSYVRNSVKVTVDAVTGETTFYALPGADPVRDTYARAFPGLFRSLDEMPEAIREHLRYPRTFLALQAEVLRQYHQNDPLTFFGQQDVWSHPQELTQTERPVEYRPEYGLLRMPGDSTPRFQLVTSFVPTGRQNLAALLAGELRPDGTFRLRLFDGLLENQLPGPRQVEALVEQDPEISQQFSLWRQGGSSVWTGHLHVVPVGDRLVYMEPVFLAAEADAIPELRRFVVSDGQRVTMQESLAAAVQALSGEAQPSGSETAGEPATGARPPSGLPAEALDLLDLAEARLRAGDWSGFGEALGRLRTLLRNAGGGDDSG